jgi:hypothetical protein
MANLTRAWGGRILYGRPFARSFDVIEVQQAYREQARYISAAYLKRIRVCSLGVRVFTPRRA